MRPWAITRSSSAALSCCIATQARSSAWQLPFLTLGLSVVLDLLNTLVAALCGAMLLLLLFPSGNTSLVSDSVTCAGRAVAADGGGCINLAFIWRSCERH